MENTYCIYMHVNKINNKKYVGMTKYSDEPEKRWVKGNGYRNNKLFLLDIQKYGWGNFEHIILENKLTYEEALKKEKKYIIKHKSNDKIYGYNIAVGYSKPHSDETKQKLSELHKGMHAGNKNPMYGKTRDDETKQKISKKLKGRSIPEDVKLKISQSQKGRTAWNKGLSYKGKPLSDETKQKLSEAMSGKKHTIESRKKISESLIGEKNPFYGKTHSEESRKKMSESRKGKRTGIDNPFSKKCIVYFNNIKHETNSKIEMVNLFSKNYNLSIMGALNGKLPNKLKDKITFIQIGDKIVYKRGN